MSESDPKASTQLAGTSGTSAASPSPSKKTHDDEPKRATFGVRYPREQGADLLLATKEDLAKLPPPASTEDKATISEKRITIRVRLRTFAGLLFRGCNFHNTRGRTASRIRSVTFEQCDFERTFMGTTAFHRVRFRDCTFENCDFSNSEFFECVFERCKFINCSAESAVFTRTEIDASEFLNGISFPRYNLKNKNAEYTAKLLRFWVEARLRLAEQLFRSNGEINHSEYLDKALLELKRAQLRQRYDLWRHGSAVHAAPKRRIRTSLAHDPAGPLRLLLSWVNITLTRGGTSLQNLVVVLLILTAIYPFLLAATSVTLNETRVSIAYGSAGEFLESYWTLFLASASLILGFGFTAFKASSVGGMTTTVLGATFGIFWYALLIPVIIRKIYR